MQANADKYAFYYSRKNKNWELVKNDVDGKFLSTNVAGGFASNFVGSTIAVYATSLGMQSNNLVDFDWFEYKGDDKVYK